MAAPKKLAVLDPVMLNALAAVPCPKKLAVLEPPVARAPSVVVTAPGATKALSVVPDEPKAEAEPGVVICPSCGVVGR